MNLTIEYSSVWTGKVLKLLGMREGWIRIFLIPIFETNFSIQNLCLNLRLKEIKNFYLFCLKKTGFEMAECYDIYFLKTSIKNK